MKNEDGTHGCLPGPITGDPLQDIHDGSEEEDGTASGTQKEYGFGEPNPELDWGTPTCCPPIAYGDRR